MKVHFILLSLFSFLEFNARAQLLNPQLVNSAGSFIANGSYNLTYSVGEPVIITKHGRPVAQLTSTRPFRVGHPIFGLHRGQLTELDAASHDQPVVDPSAWTADEANLT